MIYLKSEDDLKDIRHACDIWKKVKHDLINLVKVGMTTRKVDKLANKLIRQYGGAPTFYHLYDFPGYICISVNDQLIHGIGGDYVLQPNDMITCDVGVSYHHHVCDAAYTWILPPNDDVNKQKILQACATCLDEAIKVIHPGGHIGDIENKIHEVATSFGYEVIKDYGGHGCGNLPHEDPMIMNYGKQGSGVEIVPGMVLCIEPMLLSGSDKYIVDVKNNWTVSSKNHQLTCHCEHMVYVSQTGYEVLTED